MKTINVELVGAKFMGRMHSNAWIKAPLFFETPLRPVLKAVCGSESEPVLRFFARQWGWQEWTRDWRTLVERPDIEILDIAAPTYLHHEMAMGAARAGRERGKSRPKAGWIEPNFHDGVRIMQVLEAGMESARTGRAVKIGERKRWARTVCAGEAEHKVPPTIRKGGRDGRRAR